MSERGKKVDSTGSSQSKDCSLYPRDHVVSGKFWVDPPQGYTYGFPAVWDTSEHENVKDFLASKGYPSDKQVSWIRMWNYEQGD